MPPPLLHPLPQVLTLSRLTHGHIVRYYQAWIQRRVPKVTPIIPNDDLVSTCIKFITENLCFNA